MEDVAFRVESVKQLLQVVWKLLKPIQQMPTYKLQRFLHLQTQVHKNRSKGCYTLYYTDTYYLLLSLFEVY